MHQTRLYETLLTLSKAELRAFERFVHSPFFNRQPRTIALYAYLEQCIASDTKPSEEAAFASCSPANTPYNATTMRLMVSELYKHLEHFLVYQERFGERDYAFKTTLCTVYRKRGLARQYEKTMKDAQAAIVLQPHRHDEYFAAQYQLEYENYQFMVKNGATIDTHLSILSDLEDTAYLARKLKLACLALAQKGVYKVTYELSLLPQILQYLQIQEKPLQPTVALYYYCYNFLADGDNEDDYQLFKHYFFEHQSILPHDERRNLHLLAINYGIKKSNELRESYFQETFDFYRSAIDNQLLLENGVLSHFAFGNIVAIALKLKQTDWAEQFILNNEKHLEKAHREPVKYINLARVAYERRQLKDALPYLKDFDDRDLFSNLISKTLRLKIYYELNELDLLEAQLSALENYIRRKKVLGYHRQNYLNIVRYIRQLSQINRHDKQEVNAFREKIAAEKVLTEKTWILNMCK